LRERGEKNIEKKQGSPTVLEEGYKRDSGMGKSTGLSCEKKKSGLEDDFAQTREKNASCERSRGRGGASSN